MAVVHTPAPKIDKCAVYLVLGDRTALNVDQIVRVAVKKSDDAIKRVNGYPISISVGKRRGDDWPHGRVIDATDSANNFAYLSRF